ncbi:hypothetical protein Nepgr_010806 [Nepenthes gracilis]|uniref:Uncharacterized protein n=1 Tax=Nepenthes gracilis TaxID=150966 RepID=A0AAD3SDX8_NEPGR|nr:hypothetical protein Nepgr_010806 [Nepenthes gracilis]
MRAPRADAKAKRKGLKKWSMKRQQIKTPGFLRGGKAIERRAIVLPSREGTQEEDGMNLTLSRKLRLVVI